MITAANSKQLLAAIDRHNAANPDQSIFVNWGREGSNGTWFAHGQYGSRMRTGLRFSEVIDFVNREIELNEPATA